MSDRQHPVTTYLTDAEKRQVEQWATETQKSQSQLLRDAILEYTDRDRMARIEEKLDMTLQNLGADTHTHATTGSGTVRARESVPEKARAVADRLYQNHESPISASDVELAIEDIAGGDDRTVGKYEEQLKKRGLLFEHPMESIWTDDRAEWVEWVEAATVQADIFELVDEYRMSTEEYIQIAETIEAEL